MKNIIDLIARIFISTFFYFEALDSFWFYDHTKATMQLYGVNWNIDFLLTSAIILLFLGSTLVLLGYYSNIGAVMLLIYFVPTTFIIYSFWNDPETIRRMQSINFMRNLAMIGGLLLLVVNKPGNYSMKRLIYVMRLPR